MATQGTVVDSKTYDELERLYWDIVNEYGWSPEYIPILNQINQIQGEIVLADQRISNESQTTTIPDPDYRINNPRLSSGLLSDSVED